MRQLAFLAVMGFLSIGCSSSTSDESGGVDGSDDGSASGGQQLVLTSTNFFGASTVSYMAAVDTLARPAPDYTNSVEIPGIALVAAPEPPDGSVYLVTDVSPLVVSYTVNADGTFTRGQELNLSGQGYTGMNGHRGFLQFVSPTKAYLIDMTALQLIVWNPSTMTFVKKIPMPGLRQDDKDPESNFLPRFRGAELVFSVHYASGELHTSTKEAKFVFVDTVTDAVQIVDYTECGGFRFSVLAEDGDIYFGVGAPMAADYTINSGTVGTPPCIVRLKAGAHEIDPTFKMAPSDVTGLATSGNFHAGPDGTFFTLGFDPSLYMGKDPPTADDWFFAPAWRFYRSTLGSTERGEVVPGMPETVGTTFPLEVDGKPYLVTATGDFSETTLWDASVYPPEKGITFKDLFGVAVRAR